MLRTEKTWLVHNGNWNLIQNPIKKRDDEGLLYIVPSPKMDINYCIDQAVGQKEWKATVYKQQVDMLAYPFLVTLKSPDTQFIFCVDLPSLLHVLSMVSSISTNAISLTEIVDTLPISDQPVGIIP